MDFRKSTQNFSTNIILIRNRLNINRLESIAKLYSYYITNVASELKYANINITNNNNENQIENLIRIFRFGNQEFNEFDESNEFEYEESDNFDKDENFENEELEFEEFKESQETGILNNVDDYFNFNNDEFRQALNMNISVVIKPYELEISNNNTKFDTNELLNTLLKK
ncbi:10857_t:CDS:2 [Dentiscutata heterogama]|uniref:10857_t:CDS:1 n=1 Tax=Dentiscutata heterogama TaxID=1316150 RepID=A0ACA9P8H8_9GLOM|nr:10857_t:CDS:2 [Dentiscutata heterogama]